MAKYGSPSFAVFLADGFNLLAAKVKNFSYKPFESLTEQTDGLGDDHRENTPTGVQQATITQDGALFDDGTANMHLAWRASGVTSRILSWAPFGNTIGQPFVGALSAFKTGYEMLVKIGELSKANASYQVSGDIDEGVIVQAHGAVTADGDNASVDFTTRPQRAIPITSNSVANPTVVTTPVAHGLETGAIIFISGVSGGTPTINGERTVTVISPTTFSIPVNASAGGTGGSFVRANSPNGGVGYQQVSAFSGLTGYIGKIRDSADDSTYADLVTFANVTSAPGAQRIEVAGVVDRYLRYSKDVTGTGSTTLFAGFARY